MEWRESFFEAVMCDFVFLNTMTATATPLPSVKLVLVGVFAALSRCYSSKEATAFQSFPNVSCHEHPWLYCAIDEG